jgi:hypothetical protein
MAYGKGMSYGGYGTKKTIKRIKPKGKKGSSKKK